MGNYKKDRDKYKPKFSGIYGIRNIVNGKIYVGQSYNIHKRWIEHRYSFKNNIHHNQKFQNAWNKYGEDNFYFFVIEKCEQDIINEREIFWIDYYNSANRDYGYNLSTGGENSSEGSVWSDEMRDNASKLRSPKKVVQVDIYGNIIKIWRSISYASRELKLSNACIKRCCEHNGIHCGNYLWFYEEDELIYDKDYIKNHVLSNSSYFNIPILQYDLDGNFIMKFSSFNEIQSTLHITNLGDIRRCCNHQSYCSNNFIWVFELDNFEITEDFILKCKLLTENYEIEQYDFDANLVNTYTKYTLPSQFNLKTIISNCNNMCKSAYGFIWKYKNDNRKIITKEYIINNDIHGKTKTLCVFDKDMNLIKRYNSLKDAVNDGYTASCIRESCKEKSKIYKGYIWRYGEAS